LKVRSTSTCRFRGGLDLLLLQVDKFISLLCLAGKFQLKI
jgi:hypothetical protein